MSFAELKKAFDWSVKLIDNVINARVQIVNAMTLYR